MQRTCHRHVRLTHFDLIGSNPPRQLRTWCLRRGSAVDAGLAFGSATNSPLGCSALSGFKSLGDPWKSNSPVAGAVVFMVVREGLDPPARGFSVPCSTN